MLQHKGYIRNKLQTNYKGIYFCPLCRQRKGLPLQYPKEHLHIVLKLSNSFFNFPMAFCPHCEKQMILEKIVDHLNRIVLDTRGVFRKEIKYLRAIH